jgi:hypothetical protein
LASAAGSLCAATELSDSSANGMACCITNSRWASAWSTRPATLSTSGCRSAASSSQRGTRAESTRSGSRPSTVGTVPGASSSGSASPGREPDCQRKPPRRARAVVHLLGLEPLHRAALHLQRGLHRVDGRRLAAGHAGAHAALPELGERTPSRATARGGRPRTTRVRLGRVEQQLVERGRLVGLGHALQRARLAQRVAALVGHEALPHGHREAELDDARVGAGQQRVAGAPVGGDVAAQRALVRRASRRCRTAWAA